MSGPGPVTAAASLLRPLPAPGSPVPFPLGLSSGLAAPGNPQSSPGAQTLFFCPRTGTPPSRGAPGAFGQVRADPGGSWGPLRTRGCRACPCRCVPCPLLWPGSHRGQGPGPGGIGIGIGIGAGRGGEVTRAGGSGWAALFHQLPVRLGGSAPASPAHPGHSLLSLSLFLELPLWGLGGGLGGCEGSPPPRTCPWSCWTDWDPDSMSPTDSPAPGAHQGPPSEEFGARGRPAPDSWHPGSIQENPRFSLPCPRRGAAWREPGPESLSVRASQTLTPEPQGEEGLGPGDPREEAARSLPAWGALPRNWPLFLGVSVHRVWGTGDVAAHMDLGRSPDLRGC